MKLTSGMRPAALAVVALTVAACSSLSSPFAPQPSGRTGVVAQPEPLNPGQPLHCVANWQLDPAAATRVLEEHGWRVSFVLVEATGPDTGRGLPLESPPGGVVTGLTYGVPGWLQMFVSPVGDPNARPLSRPLDCP